MPSLSAIFSGALALAVATGVPFASDMLASLSAIVAALQ